MDIKTLLQAQREYFLKGETLDVSFRINALKKLYSAIENMEEEISHALMSDLGKSGFEGYMCEIGMTLSEISYMLKHIKSFSKKQKAPTPMAQFYSKSYVLPHPYGNVLIMSPWNYPFLLTVEPLVNAIAAGNTAIVKPSAYSSATSETVKKLISSVFAPEYVAVVTGGREENKELLNQKFDFIFFTGSQNVGKEVLRKSAENLTPAVLELGGKSPCIVDETANIPIAARRIVFGKYLNCGQTCVAPDFILCHKSVKDEFVKAVKEEIKAQFGENPLLNSNYGKIINQKHFERLLGLIDKDKTVYGGEFDAEKQKIAPTVMDNVTFDDAVMKEEIFGPIMPIIAFENVDELYPLLKSRSKPLAFYMFSEDKKRAERLMSTLSFGGGCINDTIIHLATPHMPFGGVGESGMGAYHGKFGFDTFSHRKAIVDKSTKIDLKMRYQPYTDKNAGLVRKFLK